MQISISDWLPMCPNDQCRLPYRFESVQALKALLPQHAKYFANLALEMSQGYDAIRDDTVTVSILVVFRKFTHLNFFVKKEFLKIGFMIVSLLCESWKNIFGNLIFYLSRYYANYKKFHYANFRSLTFSQTGLQRRSPWRSSVAFPRRTMPAQPLSRSP